jgi:hypothetical protein
MQVAPANSTIFSFHLVTSCGDTLGSIQSADPHFRPGDTVVLDDTGYWVRSVIPLERIAEYIDAPANGLLEVEPLWVADPWASVRE